MKRVGTRITRAMPIQKREKRRALMKERASVPSAKARNRATGVEERRTCIRAKVYRRISAQPMWCLQAHKIVEKLRNIQIILVDPEQMQPACSGILCEYLG